MLSTRHILPAAAAILVIFVCWSRAQEAAETPFRPFINCKSHTVCSSVRENSVGASRTLKKGDPGEHALARLEGCATEDVCPLYRNTSAKLEMQFRVNNNTRGVYRRIYGLFEKVMVPYGRETSICDSTASIDDDVKCSQGDRGLREGHTYQHTGAFFVKPFFPKVKVDVAVYVYDKEGTNKYPIACVMIPVQILDKES
ncbi:hypothetical protein HPB49_022939 [Dermacentor silvarum]|uniref:Uncharacterized protein n=1 Tax=Dermacentor silvarum TaxID=543639 RepID=A0ACB8CI38_DERSI|nr:hypothetical protein HPB49_022939 [Dermacentor silvarum]